jgi:DNA-binding NarL/FixJ family response regulator
MPITVCIVEDDLELGKSMARYLNSVVGFCCLGEFASGEEAREFIPLKKPAVALMDINLPGMSGVECVRKLRGVMPDLQVVMLTVYEDTDQVFQSLAAGAVGYLVKSTKPAQLLQAIRDVHQGGSPMSNHIGRAKWCRPSRGVAAPNPGASCPRASSRFWSFWPKAIPTSKWQTRWGSAWRRCAPTSDTPTKNCMSTRALKQ